MNGKHEPTHLPLKTNHSQFTSGRLLFVPFNSSLFLNKQPKRHRIPHHQVMSRVVVTKAQFHRPKREASSRRQRLWIRHASGHSELSMDGELVRPRFRKPAVITRARDVHKTLEKTKSNTWKPSTRCFFRGGTGSKMPS